MTSKSELKKELKKALLGIGSIIPWFDKNLKRWIYSNALYPIECEGNCAEEVIEKYPKCLEVFIEYRRVGKLDSIKEKKAKERIGGCAGKEPTIQISVPRDIAVWLNYPGVVENIRQIMSAYPSQSERYRSEML